MIDNDLRKHVEEEGYESVFFDNPSFDGSIIGVAGYGKIVYSFDSMIEELCEDENMSHLDAVSFIEYNTIRSLPYIKEEIRPVVVYSLRD